MTAPSIEAQTHSSGVIARRSPARRSSSESSWASAPACAYRGQNAEILLWPGIGNRASEPAASQSITPDASQSARAVQSASTLHCSRQNERAARRRTRSCGSFGARSRSDMETTSDDRESELVMTAQQHEARNSHPSSCCACFTKCPETAVSYPPRAPSCALFSADLPGLASPGGSDSCR